MTSWIKAINAYRPRLSGAPPMEIDELAARLSIGTLVTQPIAQMVLQELARELAEQLSAGVRVRLPGIGIFSPHIRLDGSMYPSVRLDKSLRAAVSHVDAFHGGVVRRESIGMDMAALKERWDREHPDDPMDMPVKGVGAGAGTGTGATKVA
ncbi:MAG: hypothetical protein IPG72_12550 [Ardenticatenales bacterium]|jgi:hypothetical protein|nr:hypothetical protein [Ardenticatenales bacterium]